MRTLRIPAFLALFLACSLACDQRLQDYPQSVRPGAVSSAQPAETNESGYQSVGPQSGGPRLPKETSAQPTSGSRDGWTPIPISGAAFPGSSLQTTAAGEYLFCFWNVENFFDDVNDGRTGQGDKEYDPWLANHPDILKLKMSKLTDALLAMNGRGPDILAIAEVESLRAAQLLQYALNARLPNPELHYRNVLMKEVKIGRHIAPAILTRLPVVADRTRHLGTAAQRIIEAHVLVEGRELVVIASHWTSRLRNENVNQRSDYADKIYGECNAIWHSNPAADILVCGDFNDNPADTSVTQHLHATGDMNAVRNTSRLSLYNLFADKSATGGYGTEYERGWNIFDQIVVSPGTLDGVAWNVEPETLKVGNNLARPGDANRKPWRFGGEKDQGPRGYSDHFPVMVKLRVR